MAGYGRKKTENLRQRDKLDNLEEKVGHLNEALQDEIDEINVHEHAIANLIPKERRLRAKTKLDKGERFVPEAIRDDFIRLGKKIRYHQRAIKKIEKTR